MKKILACVLAIVFFIIPLTSCKGNTDNGGAPYEDWVNVSNEFTTEYNLFVPNKWSVKTSAGYIALYLAEGKDKSNFSVQSTSVLLSEIKTAEDFWNDYRNTLIENLGVTVEQISVKTDFLLDGQKAVRVEYPITVPQVGNEPEKVRIMQVFCIYNGVAYYMTYTANDGKVFTDHKDEVEMVLKEFRFKNNHQSTTSTTSAAQ